MFIEVILLSAGSDRNGLRSYSCHCCIPGLPVCAGRAGERQRGPGLWEELPAAETPLQDAHRWGRGGSLLQSRQLHAVGKRVSNNGRDNTCELGEICLPHNFTSAPERARGPPQLWHRCEPPPVSRCSSTIALAQTAATKACANAVFLPMAGAIAHKTTRSLEKPCSVSRCVQPLLLLLSWPWTATVLLRAG